MRYLILSNITIDMGGKSMIDGFVLFVIILSEGRYNV